MKGQSPIFEQVMLFLIGVAIFIACLSVFSIYEVYFTDIMMEDQLNEVEGFIISNILRLSKKDARGSNSISLLVYFYKPCEIISNSFVDYVHS